MHKSVRKGPRDRRKEGVPRHRVMCRASASRCEKAIETRTRREGKRACKGEE